MEHLWEGQYLWPIAGFLRPRSQHIYRNAQATYSNSTIANIMGNISTSFTTPSPRTLCHRTVSWIAGALGLRNVQMSDNIREQVRTTIVLDRAGLPAHALQERLSERLEEDPGTLAVSWTSRSGVANALSMSVQHI